MELKHEMMYDLEELDIMCSDEIDGLVTDGSASGDVLRDSASCTSEESSEARIAAIKERYDHAKSVRELAFVYFMRLALGDTLEDGELVEEIRKYYSLYVTLETGSKAVRALLEREGFDPERG